MKRFFTDPGWIFGLPAWVEMIIFTVCGGLVGLVINIALGKIEL